ncbi:uncharacterized protein LOC101845936 [Aplysia californica]|uniref:Uncharacterized protein LOC101845936 n=1 Tax=Aplysia californica TaxID=6500 RepID=A0ABM0JU25_APLCA|nr:uncharacterized protein LOC101845936 [Aplysia californica]
MATEQFLLGLDGYVLALIISVTAWAVTCCFGTFTNLVNIHAFLKIKVKDSVTLTFLVLSISDLGMVVVGFMTSATHAMAVMEMKNQAWFPIEPYGLAMISNFIREQFLTISALITTYQAVARCMCVTIPLRFRDVFTMSRTTVILCVFVSVSFLPYIPLVVGLRLVHFRIGEGNSTRLTRHLSRLFYISSDVLEMLNDVLVNLISVGLVIICLFVMLHKLRQAASFRRLSQATGRSVTAIAGSKVLSSRDIQVLKQVALISTAYVISNTPRMCIVFMRMAEPEFYVNRKYRRVFHVCVCVKIALELICASTNIFIYYSYNSKYRDLLRSLFSSFLSQSNTEKSQCSSRSGKGNSF